MALIQNVMHKERPFVLCYFMEERMEHKHIPEFGETEMLDSIGTFQVIQKKKYLCSVFLSPDAVVFL